MARFKTFVFAPIIVTAILWSTAAQAQTDDERARLHFQSGVSYFEQGRYEDSLREWQESYRLSNRHVLLMNISQAQERLFQFDAAIASLRRYLEVGGPEAENRRNTIEARIEALQRQADQFAARNGGSTAGSTETPTDASTETPEDPTQQPAESDADESTPDPTVGPTERPRRLWTWVAAGITGAFTVGAVVTGALALNRRNELDDNCPDGVCPAGQGYEDTRDSGTLLSILTDVFIGCAAAGAVATVLLIFLEGRRARRQQEAATARLIPLIGPGQAGLSLTF